MTKRTKIFSIICGAFILIAATTIFLFLTKVRKTVPAISFYGLPKVQVDAIKTQLEEISKKENISFEYLELDQAKPLEQQISFVNKPSLLFVDGGENLRQALDKADSKSGKIGFVSSITNEMTSSIRQKAHFATNANKKNDEVPKNDGAQNSDSDSEFAPETLVTALPILSSHFEIDIDFSAFKSSGLSAIATWEDLETFARIEKRTKDFPIIFAGKDAELFADLLGTITEAFYGLEDYNKAAELLCIKDGEKFNATRIAKRLTEDSNAPFSKPISFLNDWYKKGLIHKDVFALSKNDVRAFLKARLASVAFMSLDDHREYDTKVISRYASIYFPSPRNAGERNFVAPVTYAVPFESREEISQLCSELVSAESEEILARQTGLAPVLNHCRTPDKQASDARYWVAASGVPLEGLSKEAKLTHEELAQVMAELAEMVKAK